MQKRKTKHKITVIFRFLSFFFPSLIKNIITAIFTPVITIVLTILESGRLTSDFVVSILKIALPVTGYFVYSLLLFWMLVAFVLFESIKSAISAVFLTKALRYAEQEREYRQTNEYKQYEEEAQKKIYEEYQKWKQQTAADVFQHTGSGIFSGLSAMEAKRKYHELVKKHHPDNGGDGHTMQKIMEEYTQYAKNTK